MATDFVIRDWRLDPYDGDQAPTHIHHAGEEAFVCLGLGACVETGFTWNRRDRLA
jgi:hypothetical protein